MKDEAKKFKYEDFCRYFMDKVIEYKGLVAFRFHVKMLGSANSSVYICQNQN